MNKYRQTFLVLVALTLGSTSFAGSAKAEPTVYQNDDREVYIFHPEDRDNSNQSSDKKVYHGSEVDYYRGPARTGYRGPNSEYYRGPRRTIYNGSKVDYYRGPRTTVIRGENRTYVKPNRY